MYYPYNKPNNTPLYINTKSNHPTFSVKQLPKTVNKESQFYPVMKVRLIVYENSEVLINGKKPTRLSNCRCKDSCPLFSQNAKH